jgi:ABC-type anion transport system duplicated permease subunit
MTLVLYSILGFLVFENLVELYLTFRQVSRFRFFATSHEFSIFLSHSWNRQLRVYRNSKQVPEELKDALKVETFEKAR